MTVLTRAPLCRKGASIEGCGLLLAGKPASLFVCSVQMQGAKRRGELSNENDQTAGLCVLSKSLLVRSYRYGSGMAKFGSKEQNFCSSFLPALLHAAAAGHACPVHELKIECKWRPAPHIR